MQVPPKKPHFLKPIQPGFKHGLKIPVGFLKYLKGQEQEHAVLRRGGKKWKVKVNGRSLEEGWEKFAEELDLQLGNILVFRYEGNMEFEVVIFDSSQCDTEYAEHGGVATCIPGCSIEHREPKNYTSYIKASIHNSFGESTSHLEFTVKPSCLSNGYLCLPKQFARDNGLINKKCDLIIIDGRRRSWKLMIYTSGSHVYVGGRWDKFCVANDLKVGDHIRFEVVTNGEKPIWKFHARANSKSMSASKASHYAKASGHNPIGQSNFECTIKSYCLSNGYLRIPRQFAMENGLAKKKCGLIIRGEGHKSWNLRLYTSCSRVHVGGRWQKFCVENDLKVGDHVTFEVVTHGETPIWKFRVEKSDLRGSSLHPELKKNSMNDKRISDERLKFQEQTDLMIKTSDRTAPISQVPTSTSANDANPHFISTIKPYIITNPILHLPLAFAKSNGLINKTEMILVDGKRRSWTVRLGLSGGHFLIKRRVWAQFMKANDVRVGDTYKFELIINGAIPVAYFHWEMVLGPKQILIQDPGKNFLNMLG